MTDRVKGLTITLDKDIRIDDIEPLMKAILQMKGVIDVSPVVTDTYDHINNVRIKANIREKMFEFMDQNLS